MDKIKMTSYILLSCGICCYIFFLTSA